MMYKLLTPIHPHPDKISFPFYNSQTSLEGVLTQRGIAVGGSIFTDAVRDCRPFRGGDDLLYAIHELDIIDKHRVGFTVARATEISGDEARRFDPRLDFMKGAGVMKFHSDVLFTIKLDDMSDAQRSLMALNPQHNYTKVLLVQPRFAICFGDDLPLMGHYVVPKLREMASHVTAIQEKLVDAFIAGNPP